MTSPPTGPRTHDAPSHSSSDSIDDARFTAGTMLADRYRIVGLLGKGGMGEVYRADDLRLRQPVALKFLPAHLAQNENRLERFHHEVRVARQVSHPNVCRVYDIGDADGHPFIAMEYVHGEDLASVLRRMGRPSPQKALDIARQLCAGLAAAHDKGVLHRDLKPHNVMLDDQGRVRITDFGLAGFVADFSGRKLREGTPAYMAPEQLEGREVSVKSDLYSLGLVLSELFTGKRITDEAVREQLTSTSSSRTSLSSLAEDIDPAVERVILRCLEREPAARPSSALAVAAALPGGDPLAAALAAGETPSPEMVANAGDAGGLRPAIALPLLVVILAGTVGLVATAKTMLTLVPLPKPPAALADRASELLADLGHTSPAVDTAMGFGRDWFHNVHIEETDSSPDRWARYATCRPAPLYFWYRQSPRDMVLPASEGNVQPMDPPLTVSGMALVELDPEGRLTFLRVVPPQKDDPVPDDEQPSDPPWQKLFDAAGLDMAQFREVPPEWTPVVYCDRRAAWEGHYPEQPDVPIRIEAGAYRGHPTVYSTVTPWARPSRMEVSPEERGRFAGDFVAFTLLLGALTCSLVLARRNVRLRRGDRTGANRLALTFFVVTLVGWLLKIDHMGSVFPELVRLIVTTGWALLVAATLWLLYVGLEPYVRRRWPQVLIGWSRLLAGRVRDPLVGRDLLIGGAVAVVMALFPRLQAMIMAMAGAPPEAPRAPDLLSLLGGRYLVGSLLNVSFVWFGLFILFFLFVLRVLTRREWIAMVLLPLLFQLPQLLTPQPSLTWPLALLRSGLYALSFLLLIGVMVRFGLLAALSAIFLNGFLFYRYPLTLNPSVWYSGTTFVVLALILAIYGFACHTALAGQAIFKDEMLDI